MIKTKEVKSRGSFVELSSPELLWLGESGQPYRGTLYIQFFTDAVSLDMLSLKKYITSLRQETVLLEDISEKIYMDINKTLDNESLSVTVASTARGGISSTIRVGRQYSMPESKAIVFGVR